MLSWFALGLVLGNAPPEAYEAEYLHQLAVQALRQHRYERALGLFEEVHRLAPSLRSTFNVAWTAERARQTVLAFSMYDAYLQARGPSQDRWWPHAHAAHHRLAEQLSVVRVTSSPPGAQVFLDRLEFGSFGTTPATVAVAQPGPRTLELRLAGHRPARREVVLRTGASVHAHVELEPLRGQVRIEVVPHRGAQVHLRPESGPTQSVGPGVTATVAVGRYKVWASASGYTAESTSIEVRPGRVEVRRMALIPAPRPTGRLLVTAGASPLDLFIDGARRAVTPAAIDVADGLHEVELRDGDRVVWKERVRIVAGASVLRSVPEAQ